MLFLVHRDVYLEIGVVPFLELVRRPCCFFERRHIFSLFGEVFLSLVGDTFLLGLVEIIELPGWVC